MAMDPQKKIIGGLEKLKMVCNEVKVQGSEVVLTSGCFDILHGDHLKYLCAAGELGYLIVGINSDAFVKKLKGDSRPIRNQEDRAFLMAGFFTVQLVTIFDSDYDLIREVSPDFYVASETSHVSIWDDVKRINLLKEIGSEIIELGSKKRDSTTAIIKRVSEAV